MAVGIIVDMQLLKLWSVGALLALLFITTPTVAAPVVDLYAAEVPLPAPDELDRAFRAALTEVLVKVTGRTEIVQDQMVLAAFSNPSALVQQYRQSGDGRVWVLFDRVALKNMLDGMGQPIWGADRPSTLVWVVVDSGGGRREILPAEPDTEGEGSAFAPSQPDRAGRATRAIRETLLTSAGRRGVPLVLPLVDSEDLSKVSVADIWGGFTDSIEQASARYGADGVLIGRATARSSGSAQVRWSLLLGAERASWTGSVASGPERLADALAARLATSRAGSRQLLLRVDGVDSLDAYGKVTSYLRKVSLIESFSVTNVQDNAFVYELDVRGDAERLERALALRSVLEPDINSPGMSVGATRAPDLYYRLTP